jgi:hypothetical protein
LAFITSTVDKTHFILNLEMIQQETESSTNIVCFPSFHRSVMRLSFRIWED